MSGHAIQRLVRQSPRKMRLVVDLIRGKDVNEAYAILQFNKKLAAKQIAKTLKSAVANARNNANLDVDTLKVSLCVFDEAARMRRFWPRARGSASPIAKRLSHCKVVLTDGQ
jgi:large subunit ribosomal protein L22